LLRRETLAGLDVRLIRALLEHGRKRRVGLTAATAEFELPELHTSLSTGFPAVANL